MRIATSALAAWPTNERPMRWIILTIAVFAALVGLRHLLLNFQIVSGDAGYDFRYLWVAGRTWVEGMNPYGSDFRAMGSAFISNGHVPTLWAYPPSWWPIASALGLVRLETASWLWGYLNIALCFASSFLVVGAFRRIHSGGSASHPSRDFLIGAGTALALLHFVGASVLEATTLVVVLGQTSLLIYFGLALLLYGIANGSRPMCAVGLSLVLLKPQIGLPFATIFFLYSGWSRRTLAWAIILTLVMAIPALIIDPLAPLDMVRNTLRYDGVVKATLPQVTTGVRFALWYLSGIDAGGFIALMIAVLAAVVSSLALRRVHREEDEFRFLWLCTTVATAITLALAPLHYYDFVIVACLLPAVLVSAPPFASAALLGTALIVRADELGRMTGLYDRDIKIFEGTFVSTLGAALLLVAALGAATKASFGGKGRAIPKAIRLLAEGS